MREHVYIETFGLIMIQSIYCSLTVNKIRADKRKEGGKEEKGKKGKVITERNENMKIGKKGKNKKL